MFLIPEDGTLVLYDRPEKVWSGDEASQVKEILQEASGWADRGFTVLGWMAYGAAQAFDPALTAFPDEHGRPLCYWEAHREGRPYSPVSGEASGAWLSPPSPRWDFPRYARSFDGVRQALERGDTYQVNLTMAFDLRVLGPVNLDSLAGLWLKAAGGTPGPFQMLCGHPGGWILSLSPELFFRLERGTGALPGRVFCRPMKGTRPRGQTPEEDALKAQELLASPKDRAENLMITDMIRNDLGRSALAGTVRVPRLFALETYPTVHQMVSDVTAETRDNVPQVMEALFPCASITGAPKVRTMELIRDLEQEPRGIYTGTMGRWDSRSAQFNVAIRTLELDPGGQGTYRAGGGVVWDSAPEEEWKEIQVKTRILSPLIFPADLVETLKWTPGEGFSFREAHHGRLAASAAALGFPPPPGDLFSRWLPPLEAEPGQALRVRLVWTREGEARWTWSPLQPLEEPVPLVLSSLRTGTAGLFFRHKTTRREIYDRLLARGREEAPGAGEVLMVNEKGQITEGTFTNLAYSLGGKLYTPPLRDGLLPGLFRESLLLEGRLEERSLELKEAPLVEAWWVMNSVRGLLKARLLTSPRPEA